MAQYIRDLVREGVLRTVSVGFQPEAKEPLTKDADARHGPFRFTRQTLLECSLVSVPANPNALAIAKDLPRDVLAEVFRKPASEDRVELRAVHAKPGNALVSTRPKMQTLSQKIQASQKRITELRDKLVELEKLPEQTAEEKELSDEIPAEIEAAENELASLERKEKALAPRAGTPVTRAEFEEAPKTGEVLTPLDVSRSFTLPKKQIDAADFMIKAMSVGIKAYGTQVSLDHALNEMYPKNEGVRTVLRAAVNPAMTTTTGYAAELVQIANGAFMDRIIANSLYEPLASLGGRYDLGRNGSLKIPTRTATSKAAGAWVGEGGAKPVKKISLAPITLTPHKLAVITTFTEEMAFYSTPAIEGVLRKSMLDDTREALDGFLIDNVASSTARPAGLLNGVTPISAASTGTTLEKIVADLNALIAPMEAAGGGNNVVLLMNPAQARKIGAAQTTTGDFAFADTGQAASKFGISRIVASTTVAAGTVIAVDASWFATVTGDTPRFAVSTEATLHEEDTTPLALGTGTQGSGVLAVPMRSLFQTDSVAIRLSLYVSWGMTRSAMVQTITAVGW
jgi:HK97 family phage major capsid protein